MEKVGVRRPGGIQLGVMDQEKEADLTEKQN